MLLAYNGLQFTLISQTVGIETQYSKIVLKTYQNAARQILNTVTICLASVVIMWLLISLGGPRLFLLLHVACLSSLLARSTHVNNCERRMSHAGI